MLEAARHSIFSPAAHQICADFAGHRSGFTWALTEIGWPYQGPAAASLAAMLIAEIAVTASSPDVRLRRAILEALRSERRPVRAGRNAAGFSQPAFTDQPRYR